MLCRLLTLAMVTIMFINQYREVIGDRDSYIWGFVVLTAAIDFLISRRSDTG